MGHFRNAALLILITINSILVYAQDPLKEFSATRIEHAPKIDGILNDPCWENQPAITTFPYLASLIILFFRSDIFSRERFLIYTLFFVFALLLAVSSTGLVCLATIFLYAIYSNFKRNSVPLSVIFLMPKELSFSNLIN